MTSVSSTRIVGLEVNQTVNGSATLYTVPANCTADIVLQKGAGAVSHVFIIENAATNAQCGTVTYAGAFASGWTQLGTGSTGSTSAQAATCTLVAGQILAVTTGGSSNITIAVKEYHPT